MFNTDPNDLKPFADLARSFAVKELAGKVAQHDRYPFGDFYQDILEKVHHLGFLGVTLPTALGGIAVHEAEGVAELVDAGLQQARRQQAPLHGLEGPLEPDRDG